LSDDYTNLLKNCGIKFGNGFGKLKSEARNFPLEIFFLRDDDIPQYVEDGVADVGIVGENVVGEKQCAIEVRERLGFGKCRLALAVPKSFAYHSIKDLDGKRIATSYPKILSDFLREKAVAAELHVISGSVEIAPGIGLADAVCDLVSSGSTLFTNGLREVETVLLSEAVLIARPNLEADLQAILDKLIFRVRAVCGAAANKYILLNAPDAQLDEIIKILPGIKSPTVMTLAEKGWSSIHSVVKESDFWEIVERLEEKGAEGILVLSIDQMVG
jgi:ATP phosphoribosyltransferase